MKKKRMGTWHETAYYKITKKKEGNKKQRHKELKGFREELKYKKILRKKKTTNGWLFNTIEQMLLSSHAIVEIDFSCTITS